jgi:hypothetical protein
MAQHKKNKRASNWNKHSKKRAKAHTNKKYSNGKMFGFEWLIPSHKKKK